MCWLLNLLCFDQAPLNGPLGHDLDLVPDGSGALDLRCSKCNRVIELWHGRVRRNA